MYVHEAFLTRTIGSFILLLGFSILPRLAPQDGPSRLTNQPTNILIQRSLQDGPSVSLFLFSPSPPCLETLWAALPQAEQAAFLAAKWSAPEAPESEAGVVAEGDSQDTT